MTNYNEKMTVVCKKPECGKQLTVRKDAARRLGLPACCGLVMRKLDELRVAQ